MPMITLLLCLIGCDVYRSNAANMPCNTTNISNTAARTVIPDRSGSIGHRVYDRAVSVRSIAVRGARHRRDTVY